MTQEQVNTIIGIFEESPKAYSKAGCAMVRELKDAIEKQLPRKLNYGPGGAFCPRCYAFISEQWLMGDFDEDYCYGCGQRIIP